MKDAIYGEGHERDIKRRIRGKRNGAWNKMNKDVWGRRIRGQ